MPINRGRVASALIVKLDTGEGRMKNDEAWNGLVDSSMMNVEAFNLKVGGGKLEAR